MVLIPEWKSLGEIAEGLGVPLISGSDLEHLAIEGRYDGPLSGYILQGKIPCFFEAFEDDYWRRIFYLYKIPEDLISEVQSRIFFLSKKYTHLVTDGGRAFCKGAILERETPVEVSFGRVEKIEKPIIGIFCFGEEPSEETLERVKQMVQLFSPWVIPEEELEENRRHYRVLISGWGGLEFLFWNPDFNKHAEMGIYNDGTYCLTLVDDQKDPETEDEEWFQSFESPFEEDSLVSCDQKIRKFLGLK